MRGRKPNLNTTRSSKICQPPGRITKMGKIAELEVTHKLIKSQRAKSEARAITSTRLEPVVKETMRLSREKMPA